jgi:acyl homoserine lactone synthase
MRVEIVNVYTSPAKADLVRQFLALRRDIFVEEKCWSLNVFEGLEWEQYDYFPLAHYVLAIEDGEVVGGARLIRCDAQIGAGSFSYSYMIKDACLGKIALPRDLCTGSPPEDDWTWELTRLVAAGGNRAVARAVLEAANHFLVDQGARRCLFLGPPAFMRMARSMGFAPEPMGPSRSNRDGTFIAFACACIQVGRSTTVPTHLGGTDAVQMMVH